MGVAVGVAVGALEADRPHKLAARLPHQFNLDHSAGDLCVTHLFRCGDSVSPGCATSFNPQDSAMGSYHCY